MTREEFLPLEPGVETDIGSGVTIVLRVHGGRIIGLEECHPHKTTGAPCAAFVMFKGEHIAGDQERPTWEVLSTKPLTLSPSILCRTCGNHGYIREGRWVPDGS